jgi:tetratricopeptide (TPR) repeat protein
LFRSSPNWPLALILVAITLLAYQPAWNGKPIWDDEIHITAPQLRSLDGLARIWTDPAAAPQYYPLLHTIFWLEYKLWDGAVAPYHLVTIFCHALLALLIWRILLKLNVPGAWLAAAVFALHPAHVESVAWFSEIKNTLSGVFAAAAMLMYLAYDEDRHRGSYFGALALFALGLMTKTAIVALPAALLIVFWWKRGSLKLRRDVLPLAPFFALGIVAAIVTVWVEQKFCAEHGEIFNFSLLDRCLIAGRLFWFYLGNIFWPSNLSLIYAPWNVDSSKWWQYLFPICAAALVVICWLVRNRWRAPLAVLLCFGAFLFPVLGFFNLSFFMTTSEGSPHSAIFRADHFQYLADVPVIALVCAVGAELWQRSATIVRPILATGATCILLLLTLLTTAQSRTYRDSEVCFRNVVAKNPDSTAAHNNLGNVLRQNGALDEAIAQYRRALEIDPNYQFARVNLGVTLVQKGDPASAIPLLQEALRKNPNDPKASYSLGAALAQTGWPEEAIVCYNHAIQLQPDFVDAHTNVANLLLERGDGEGAMLHYRKAVELQPDSPMTHYNLAVAMTRNGDDEAAIAELRAALKLDPDYADAGPLLQDLLLRRSSH